MSSLLNVGSALKAFFTSSRSPQQPPVPPLDSFPQFSKLPVELRLKIWTFALNSRNLGLHLHLSHPNWLNDEQRYEGYAPAWPEHSSLTKPYDGPEYVPEEEGENLYGYPDSWHSQSDPRPCHMALTPCSALHCCDCSTFPFSSAHAQPLPTSLFACRESRDANIGQYIRGLEDEYDTRGCLVVHPMFRLKKSPAYTLLPRTGIVINPSVDVLLLRANVASRSSIQQIHHLASILATQLQEVQKVVLQLEIGMPPYKFWQRERFQYWKRWGEDGWWLPMRFLLKLKGLREVVLVYNPKEKMLPLEWKTRTESQWLEEFSKLEERWPLEWEGNMPSLKFVGDIENA